MSEVVGGGRFLTTTFYLVTLTKYARGARLPRGPGSRRRCHSRRKGD